MYLKRIRDLRESKDLKQATLAELLRVRQSTYSGYENGQINIPIDALIQLADFYQVSLDYIAGRTNNPAPPVL